MNFLSIMKQRWSLAVIFSSKLLLFILCLIVFLIKMAIGGGGGTKQACAACKHQRRKCEKNCKLARYFPADQPKKFQNVHRLFGVSSIIRILNKVDDDKKDIAMNTIIFESNIRARYPVRGCLGLVCTLQKQLQNAVEELASVNRQLARYKQQYQYQSRTSSLSQVECMDVKDLIAGNAGGFNVDMGEDVKPFIRNYHEQNQNLHCFNNSSSMLFSDGLGNIESQTLSLQGTSTQQEMELISVHDDVPFVVIDIDRDKKHFTESKGKEVRKVPRVESKATSRA